MSGERTKRGWLTRPALRSGLSEQAAWIDDDGTKHTVTMSRPGGGVNGTHPPYMVHHIRNTQEGAFTERIRNIWELADARAAFKEEAQHG